MFGTKLEETVKAISGGHSAIVMGFDGIQVDMYSKDTELDIETIGMEFSVVLKEVKKAVEMLEAGLTTEFIVRTDKIYTIVRIINEEYFMAVILDPTGNIGKARYLLRLITPEFNKELS